jgi:hypothetical protein
MGPYKQILSNAEDAGKTSRFRQSFQFEEVSGEILGTGINIEVWVLEGKLMLKLT